jgi:uncharacterized protein (TIGR02145 family)
MRVFTQQRRVFLLAALLAIAAQAVLAQQQSPYYAGDGGKGIRLAVLEPVGKGLSADEQWVLSLVQGSIAGDFNKFSAMTIIDRQNMEKIFAEWKESMSGSYSDADRVKIGNLANASHILTGSISKIKDAFMLELAVTDVASGVRRASYSPTQVSLAGLENLSAVKAASADLLKQLGVGLTNAALGELTRTANAARLQAETMLARGIAAQRQGTEVAALSYFFQAAALDSSLFEASSRSLVMAANISSGNIGADARNDIAWRKNWMARLKETEETFRKMIDAADPPYSLSYFTNIRKEKIDYEKETIDLGIEIAMSANKVWFNAMDRSLGAADAVLDGLNNTKKKREWGLDGWAENFRSRSYKQYYITVVFELVNEKGRAIGSQSVKLNPDFGFTSENNDSKMVTYFNEYHQETVYFKAIKADDVSNSLTIRIVSVNGAPPQNARFAISAISIEKQSPLIDNRDGNKYKTVKIGGKMWMAENLKYQPKTGNSWCCNDSDSCCVKYGRLYDWKTAMTVCPAGWHLPTQQEWNDLVEAAGGYSAGKNLKSSSYYDGTDIYGFSALLGQKGTRWNSEDIEGNWWTETTSQSGEGGEERAYSRNINYNTNVKEKQSYIDERFSVRCIQDDGRASVATETGYAQKPKTEPEEQSSYFAPDSNAKSLSETAHTGYGAVRKPTKRQQSQISETQPQSSSATFLRVNGQRENVSVHFDRSGGTKTLTVSTDGDGYDVTELPEWCSAKKYGDSFSLTCAQRDVATGSYDWFNVTSGDKTVKVSVAQDVSGEASSSSGNAERRPSSSAEPFKPTAVYAYASMSTIDSRGYGGEKRRGGKLLGGLGYDIHGAVETKNTFGLGIFAGGGTYGDDVISFGIGVRVKNLFWLVKRHIAVPMSIDIDMQTMSSNIESRVAAEFIDAMGASDRGSDAEIKMKMLKYDLRPSVGLQVFLGRKLSISASYAYNLNIFPYDWYVEYKIPGKTYDSDDDGDKFDVPEKYSPLQGAEESFLGVPGELRVSLNVHINN